MPSTPADDEMDEGDERADANDSPSSAMTNSESPQQASTSARAKQKPAPSRKTSRQRNPTRKIDRRLQRCRRRRASNQPILAMPLRQYEEIVRMTATRFGTVSPIPPPEKLPELLRGRGVDPSRWFDVIEHFGNWFHWAAGRADHLTERIERASRHWIQGIRNCRDVFT